VLGRVRRGRRRERGEVLGVKGEGEEEKGERRKEKGESCV